jgi:uroporphyrinogen-III synthase
MKTMLVLRPEPGAATTLARAIEAGLVAVAAPIFTLAAKDWSAPDPAAYDALMLTSANAVRLSGPSLGRYRHLPAYAVGQTTAYAAIDAGFADVRAGNEDASALIEAMARDGIARPLHLAGREHRAVEDAPFAIERRIVYAADPVDALPAAAAAALAGGAVALLHSPRAARCFAILLDAAHIDPASVSIAAISAAAATGTWQEVAIAATPDDSALLAAAARLCEKG